MVTGMVMVRVRVRVRVGVMVIGLVKVSVRDNLANIHMLTLRDVIVLVFLVAFLLNIAKM